MVSIRKVIRFNTHNKLMLFDLPGCNADKRNGQSFHQLDGTRDAQRRHGQWAYEVNGYHVIVSIRIVVSIRIAYNE